MAQWLSAQQIKALVPVSKNLQLNDDIEAVLDDARLKYMRPILGGPQYDELVQQVDSNTVTPANQALLEVLYKALAYYTMHEALPYVQFRVRDAGVGTFGGANYSADMQAYELVRRQLGETAELHRRRVEEFLQENIAAYPLFRENMLYCANNTGPLVRPSKGNGKHIPKNY
jgi:hypothetical protein